MLHLFRRRADGTFAERADVNFKGPYERQFLQRGHCQPHLVDWDRDGRTDLVVAYLGNWTLWVGLGPLDAKKEMALNPTAALAIGGRPMYFAFADWDGDGNVDLLAGVENPGPKRTYKICWFRNTSAKGPPEFARAAPLLDLPEPWALDALTTTHWGDDRLPSLVVSATRDGKDGKGWASELWLYRHVAAGRDSP